MFLTQGERKVIQGARREVQVQGKNKKAREIRKDPRMNNVSNSVSSKNVCNFNLLLFSSTSHSKMLSHQEETDASYIIR
jgi:hypothetical protein